MTDQTSSRITFRVNGTADSLPVDGERCVRPALPGRGGSDQSHDLTVDASASGAEIVSIKLANGPELRLHPENARLLLQSQQGVAAKRDGTSADDPVTVPPRLAWKNGSAARGDVLGVAMEWFKVITGNSSVATASAKTLAAAIDGRVDEGLYRLTTEPLGSLKGLPKVDLSATPNIDKLLVFVHGTFSSTQGSFGDLWTQHPNLVAELFKTYGPHVYGFDHATLARSPEQNALELYSKLPKGAQVHVVTHSRGGLVAEILARSAGTSQADAFSSAEIAEYTQSGKPAEIVNALKNLNAAISAKGARVERVVRVACPAFGTTLASNRLDAYFSVLSWGLKAAGAAVASNVVDFLDSVARERTDPAVLPGVEAMRPDSTLVTVLNDHDKTVTGELRVISGDLQGDSVWSWVKQLMSDAFYWEDNDVVVQTRSMYGGAQRTGEASFLLDRSGKTDHFHYFSNDSTASATRAALLTDGAIPDGFRIIGPQSFAGKDSSGIRGDPLVNSRKRALVIVLPGIMGSNLRRTINGSAEREWFNGWRIAGALGRLSLPANGANVVSADGSISRYYGDLQAYLNRDFDVVDFGYDWRMSINDAATALGQIVVDEIQARVGQKLPVSFVAHSMGGIVVRTMQFAHPAAWSALMAQESADWRIVMLGTPNGGSYAPMQALTGDAGAIVSTVEAVGVNPFATQSSRQIVAGFIGLLQLQADLLETGKNLGDPSVWEAKRKEAEQWLQQASYWHETSTASRLDWGIPDASTLQEAVQLRKDLDAQIRSGVLASAPLRLVLGTAPSTPTELVVTAAGYTYATTTDGDGRVTWDSAKLPGVKTWIVPCVHGDLSAADEHFAAYRDLVATGDTTAIATFDARRDRGDTTATRGNMAMDAAATVRVRNPDPLSLLTGTASAQDERGSSAAAAPRFTVAVLHGDLRYVDGTLLVGHFSGSQLVGSEKVLDELLGGAMQRSLSAGLYPLAVGTTDVFLNHRRASDAHGGPRVVIVAGMGMDGKYRSVELRTAVKQSVLRYARLLADNPTLAVPAAPDTPTAVAPSTFTLHMLSIGSGSGLPLPSCVLAAVEGAKDAAQVCERQGWPLLDNLRFVELYGNRASEILQTLRLQQRASDAGFTVTPERLVPISGARRRPPGYVYRSADYDLISVTSETAEIAVGSTPSGRREITELEFSMFTQRSRSEVTGKAVQPNLVGNLVSTAEGSSATIVGLGSTLFKLLIPLEIRGALRASDGVMLELDSYSAALPWEFLDDRNDDGLGTKYPLAVRTPLLRRLRTEVFRANPIDNSLSTDYLVVGVPKCPVGYPELPAAKHEAEAAAEALGPSTDLILNGTVLDVIGKLYLKEWRIIHVAGHGALGKDAAHTGVVLENNCFLGPCEIHGMETVPELVFVNCCHLGKIEAVDRDKPNPYLNDRPRFASSVAEELIDMGVRCVIVAGWAVKDDTASCFAKTFYSCIAEGYNFRDAVYRARVEAYRLDPTDNTWAAYQCYGDPTWRLRRDQASPGSRADKANIDPLNISSPDDLVLYLDDVAADSAVSKTQDILLDKLQRLEATYAQQWGELGSVAEAFGRAYRDLGFLARAVGWFDRAVNSQDGLASLKALEQWLNLKARWLAGESTATGDEPPPASLVDKLSALRDVAKRAVDLAKSLPTGERWSIAGSAQKRIACLTTGKQQQSALTEMLSAYDEAVKCLDATKSGGIFYPQMQYCAASIATGTQSVDFEKYLSDADAAITLANANGPNFWSHVAAVEIQVLKGVSLGNTIDATGLSQSLKTLQVAHRRTHEWNSVRVNLVFLMIVLPKAATGVRKQKSLQDALAVLVAVVNEFCKGGDNASVKG